MNDNFNSKLIFDNISYLIKEQGKKVGEVETQAGVSADIFRETVRTQIRNQE